jgi:hypothetical protein
MFDWLKAVYLTDGHLVEDSILNQLSHISPLTSSHDGNWARLYIHKKMESKVLWFGRFNPNPDPIENASNLAVFTNDSTMDARTLVCSSQLITVRLFHSSNNAAFLEHMPVTTSGLKRWKCHSPGPTYQAFPHVGSVRGTQILACLACSFETLLPPDDVGCLFILIVGLCSCCLQTDVGAKHISIKAIESQGRSRAESLNFR